MPKGELELLLRILVLFAALVALCIWMVHAWPA